MSSVNHIIIKYKWSNIIKVQITCEQVSSKISYLSAPERDVTHTPSWSKLRPEVSQYKCRNKVSQYHKSIYQTKMETIGAYHMCPPRSPSADYNCPTRP